MLVFGSPVGIPSPQQTNIAGCLTFLGKSHEKFNVVVSDS